MIQALRGSPLACLLKTFRLEFTKTIKSKWLILYGKMIWPQYKLENNDHCPKQASFYLQIHHFLKNFQCYGIGSEVS
jgi:hypothetical protein